MEENIKQDKKNKLPLITILVTMLVCCIAFAVLCLTGIIPVKTGLGYIDIRTAALVKQSAEVSDEETLRELLLLKKELAIVVTEDIEIDETFIVRGKKTLYGDATISADVAGEFRTMSIFDVQPGSVLIMDGLVLDGDGTADGINVCQDAELTYLSGTIQYMRYGIQTNGKVTLEDVLVQHSTQAGVLAAYRSKVYVNGGTYYNANSNLLYVDTNGYMEIHEGADLSVCRGDAVFNAGDLRVYGGTFHDTLARAINTEGELHMEYKGEKEDGYIEMYNIGSIAVRMNAHDDCYISDVRGVNIGTNGVYTTDLRSNGKTTVENCIFDTCAIVEGNGMSVSRKVEINDVTILNSKGGGINIRENGDVKIDGVTIDGTNGDAITIGGELEAKNVQLANVQANNIEVITDVEATISDSVLGKSKRTSVYMRKDSTLTLDNVEVQGVIDEGMFNFHVNEGSVLNLKGDTSITGATRIAICLYKNTTLNMEDGKIYGIKGTDNGAAVWVREEGAVFNMTGGSIENNTTTGSSGGVFVADKATFNMSGGTISGNSAQYSGGGVQVQGVMNFKGGTISNNKSETTGGGINVGNNAEKGIFGKLNMTGGTIANNYSVNNGGGISVSGKTTVNISGGTIKGNKSAGIGDGIHDNGNLTISGKAYITGNDIGLNNKSIVLNIKGSSLSKHSANDPLLVSPVQSTYTGDIVVKCDSNSAAKKLLEKYVSSGNAAFTLTQMENNMTVNANVADLDVTGAETVYVSNFQELKEAVETTETKRIVVVCADIEMESKITVPSGTTVCIRDDGTTRTLSRQAGNTEKFFETWYGTGFILKGTAKEKLVLDGGNADNKAEDYQQLVYVRGTTQIENVAFANNGVSDKYTGTFVNQQYGSMTIAGSTFKNGVAADGGAIQTKAGAATITDCTFINNTATNRGGAICNAKCDMVVKNCTFKNNKSLASGGAVYNAENGSLKLEGTSKAALFEGNTAKSGLGGGAICVGTGDLNITGYTFKNNIAENSNGGAIEVNSTNSIVTIKESVFDSNKNTDDNKEDKLLYFGGAVYTKAKITTVENTVFDKNNTSENGGAIYTLRGTATVKNSTFTNNTAAVNGGVVYNAEKGTLNLVGTSAESAVFANNTAAENGGAVAIGSGSIDVNGYTFDGNSGVNGGAIRFNTESIAASITNSVFKNNTASGEGGAINSWSTYEDGWKITNSTFEGNTADVNGGAFYTRKTEVTVENTLFTDNETKGQGGAIAAYGEALLAKECQFNNNSSVGNGGAIYNGNNGILTVQTTKESAFEGNVSEGNGGAICVGTGELNIDGYVFVDNSAAHGGAIRLNTEEIKATIANSVFKTNTASQEGGAINSFSTHEEGWSVKGSIFEGNTAALNGGAIYTRNAKATVGNSTFTSNTTEGQGGAITSYGKALNVTDSGFSGNSAVANGGAIYSGSNGVVTLKTSKSLTFAGNTSEDRGGAIGIGSGELYITGYTFVDNSAVHGGAIRFNTEEIKASIADSVFKNNTASQEGGAINSFSTHADGWSVTNSVFEENTAAVNGGAIYTRNAKATVENSTFTGNTTEGQGGAIISYGKALDVTNSGFDGNSSVTNGGAIYSGSNGVVTLTSKDDSVFEGNASEGNGGAICIGSGELKIDGYKFMDNSAVHGGAIRFNTEEIKATIADSTFKNNTASQEGGAINSYSTYEAGWNVTGSTFEGNTAAVHGGAIYTRNAKATVAGSTFTDNTTEGQGGAIISYGKALDITNSGFGGNSSVGNGGAIYGGSDCIVTLKSGNGSKISDNTSKADGGAIALGSGVLNLEGDYAIEGNQAGASSGAVYVANGVVFNMKGGTLSGNTSTYSGGAVQVQGVMNLSGGTISGNTSGTAGGAINVGNNAGRNVYGELYMTGGTIENNTATSNGGGIAISGGTTVDISGGSITGNTAGTIGTGIYDNGNLTISGSIYMGQDEIELNSTKVVLRVKGDSLSEHSFEEPLLISPHRDSAYGTNVVECDSAEAATSLLNYIASGNRAYILAQDEEGNIVTVEVDTITSEEMEAVEDTTDIVYVSDFEQLKEAVETTKTERIIILEKDIEMKSVITVPQEAIVQIKDNGETRTLSRYEGNTDSFFKTNYGSGLYLKGTAEGKLVLDAAASGDEETTVSTLIAGRGTVKTESVAFENNETTSVNGNGFFINQEFGITHVINTTFENGKATQGGAIYAQSGETKITNSSFTNNTATASGGAVYNAVSNELTLEVKDGYGVSALLEGNTSNGGYGGGAICVGTGNITIDGYTFKNNTSVNGSGGAIQLHSSNTIATISNSTFDNNKTVDENVEDETIYHAGAIYSCAKLLDVDNTNFTGNGAAGDGGAIYVEKGKLDIDGGNYSNNSGKEGGAIKIAEAEITTTVDNAVFTNNTATSYGGAICNYGKSGITITDCTFGGQGTETDQYVLGNKATGNGGAIYHAKGGKITLNDNNASVTALFQNNKSSENGGAICIGSGTLEVNGYEFTGNSAKDGGAIKLNNQNIVAKITDSVFGSNNASSEGGAVYNESSNESGLEITNAAFTQNHSGGSGGAIFAKRGGTVLVTDTEVPKAFDGNTAGSSTSPQKGGAIYADIGTLSVTGYHFTHNSAYDAGGAMRLAGSVTNAEFTDCEYIENYALNGYGGAISNNSTSQEDDAVTITDTKFYSNSAKYGGAIHNRESELKLVGTKNVGTEGANAIFTENTATADGGTIYVEAGNAEVSKYEFTINSAVNGGAIAVYGGQININANTTFSGNTATNRGGAIWTNTGTSGTIEDSSFTGNKASGGGGAIHKEGALTIKNTDFESNQAGGAGGAINNNGGNATIQNCDFKTNTSGGNGGAVQAVGSGAEITIEVTDGQEHVFQGNTSGGNGGAIRTNTAKLTVKRYKFDGNKASADGGAIYVDSAGSTVSGENLTFVNNSTPNGNGGAIYAKKNLPLTQCSFSTNTASGNGGAIYLTNGKTLTLTKSATATEKPAFTGNSATYGGAIYTDTGVVDVTDYTFTNNTSTYGGAVYLGEEIVGESATTYESGTLTATSCTFSNNSSTEQGGAVYVMSGQINTDKGTKFNGNTAKRGGAILMEAHATGEIMNSEFDGNTLISGGNSGGAIWKSGSLTVTNTTFKNNVSKTVGGAINSQGGNMTLENCDFISNTAGGNGGAVQAVDSGTIQISVTDKTEHVFQGNTSSGAGGALHVNNVDLTVDGVKFDGNTSTGTGGAINIGNAKKTIWIENAIVSNNNAGGQGGAISCHAATLTVKNTNVSGNHSAANGGALYTGSSCNVTLESSNGAKFENNFSGTVGEDGKVTLTGNGGAHCVGSGTLTVTGYTFDGNRAKQGGAVQLNNPQITANFTDSTFTRNEATGNGGAIYNQSTSTAEDAVSFTNCTFGGVGTTANPYALGNIAASGGAIYNVSSELKLAYDAQYKTAALFQGNKATDNGGAIYMDGGKLDVTKYNFVSNNAQNYGGAICHRTDTKAVKIDILDSTFTSNSTTAVHGGAIYHHTKDDVDITGTDFTSNVAKAGHGGAICSEGGTLTVENCDFTSNTAGKDGGAYRIAASCQATFTNGKFESNSASGNGGAVQFNTGILEITGYVFTGNTKGSVPNAINTNNKQGASNYTILSNCEISKEEISGAGVKYAE